MLNQIVLMGRLVADPELRSTGNGTPVASFRLAVDRSYSRGEDRQTDFINCVAWRQTGEFVSKYFKKGTMAVVVGRLQIRDYTDRDGNKRTAAEVVASSVEFGESKKSRDEGNDGSYGGGYSRPAGGFKTPSPDSYENAKEKASSGFSEMEEDDGGLPF